MKRILSILVVLVFALGCSEPAKTPVKEDPKPEVKVEAKAPEVKKEEAKPEDKKEEKKVEEKAPEKK